MNLDEQWKNNLASAKKELEEARKRAVPEVERQEYTALLEWFEKDIQNFEKSLMEYKDNPLNGNLCLKVDETEGRLTFSRDMSRTQG